VSGRKRALAPIAAWLFAMLAALVIGSLAVGEAGRFGAGQTLRGALAAFDLCAPLPSVQQTILELRLWKALTAAGVGGCLALAGALIQGLFRNGLASPSVLGVTSGASLGAAVAILIVGGYAPRLVVEEGTGAGALLIPLLGFVGALATVFFVAAFAMGSGRLSVPTLLLLGIAVNMCAGGLFAAIQSLTLKDWEVSRAIMAWTFGTLEDRSRYHALVVWTALLLCSATIPFLHVELDLLRGGEQDAESLGVRTGLVKVVALTAAALASAAAVSVAGQIPFVGLVVPHLVRLSVGSSHARVLVLCALFGCVFLLGAELLQRALLGGSAMQPGVLMSLVGGPFFMALLLRRRREVAAW
jgi:iron complex transport system permease protein